MRMKIAVLEYTAPFFERWFNLGDDIQTIAVSRLLPRIDSYVSREDLNQVKDECVVILNGFFLNSANWPPAPTVKPVFFGFHVAPQTQKIICSAEGIEYLKKWQPIGCRDRGTMSLLQQHGIEAYYSRCLTLTLPRRMKDPEQGEIYLVGVSKAALAVIPNAIRRKAIKVDQAKVRLPITDTHLKHQLAEAVLKQYRSKARLVITSKMHCALPCIAMGIPVVFLYDRNKRDAYRVQIIEDLIGINYVRDLGFARRLMNRLVNKKIDWNPAPIDIEDTKREIKSAFYQAFNRVAGTNLPQTC